MTIEFNDDSHIIALWFSESPEGNNWLACAQRDNKTQEIRVDYRFRYKKDDYAFNSKDEKSWYTVKPKKEDSNEKIIDTFRLIQKAGTHLGFPYHDEVMINGGTQEFLDKTKDKPYMQMKQFKVLKGGKK